MILKIPSLCMHYEKHVNDNFDEVRMKSPLRKTFVSDDVRLNLVTGSLRLLSNSVRKSLFEGTYKVHKGARMSPPYFLRDGQENINTITD